MDVLVDTEYSLSNKESNKKIFSPQNNFEKAVYEFWLSIYPTFECYDLNFNSSLSLHWLLAFTELLISMLKILHKYLTVNVKAAICMTHRWPSG